MLALLGSTLNALAPSFPLPHMFLPALPPWPIPAGQGLSAGPVPSATAAAGLVKALGVGMHTPFQTLLLIIAAVSGAGQ